ncbi:molybdate ABC transporter permease subunit [Burkholderia sp. 22PA0106]|uniref:molybdate ABC transporter permease subunit n=1 Tax=Burkholderia sp. 22PA0106 TaxID=3237371 RepID=UPI0039C46E8D
MPAWVSARLPLRLPLRHPAGMAWIGFVPALALLMLPLLSLMHDTRWGQLSAAYGDWHAVGVSAVLSTWAMLAIVALGLPLAIWLARTRSRLGACVNVLVLYSLLMPSLAMGILLVSAYGPYGTAGRALGALGLSLNNNAGSFIVAQVYGGLAYFVIAARTAFENVPGVLEEASQDLGASPARTFLRITLPLAARELTTGALVTWVRIVGEFGIVAVFSYFPQGIPVKLYINLQNSGIQSVYVLTWILVAVMLPVPVLVMSLFRGGRHARTRG